MMRWPVSAPPVGRPGFLRDERGAVSVEFTVLVPFFVFMLVLFADATTIYMTHTEMFNTAREISRRIAIGEIKSPDEAKTFAANHLFLGQRDYQVNVDFKDDVTVSVAINVYDAAIFGYFFRPLIGRQLVAVATVGEEPRIE